MKKILGVMVLLVLIGFGGYSLSAKEDLVTSNPTTLLSGAATGSATLDNGVMPGCRETAVYVSWGAGTNAGVVTIESAHSSTYAGTWAPQASVTWSAASKEDIIQITGIHGALRTRISTNVTGGTVDTYAVCN